jgi:hypothetical protein
VVVDVEGMWYFFSLHYSSIQVIRPYGVKLLSTSWYTYIN